MKLPFFVGLLPGLWVFGPAEIDANEDLGLMLAYMTWVAIATLYFFWGIFRIPRVIKAGGSTLRYQVSNWFLMGSMTAVAVPMMINVTATMLIVMFTLI